MKYTWKCQSSTCGHEFDAENPNHCPKCEHDDILIIRQPPPPHWKWILIALAVIAAFLILRCCGTIGIGTPPIIPPLKTVILTTEVHENYFEVIRSGDPADYKDLEIFAKDIDGNPLYSEELKFYPCREGDYFITYANPDTLVQILDSTVVLDFTFQGSSKAKKGACEEQLEFLRVDVNRDCQYKIMTNMDKNPNLEFSLNKNRGYEKGKWIWKYEEIKGAEYFYLRIKGTNKSAQKKIEECIPLPPAPSLDKSVVVASFDMYMNDHVGNRKQFTDLLRKYGASKVIIVYDNASMTVVDFVMKVNTSDSSILSSLVLKEANVTLNEKGNEIVKLKITTK